VPPDQHRTSTANPFPKPAPKTAVNPANAARLG